MLEQKSDLEKSQFRDLKMFGCISALSKFGPQMTQKAVLPNIQKILENVSEDLKSKEIFTKAELLP